MPAPLPDLALLLAPAPPTPHAPPVDPAAPALMKWARAIARGIRTDYRFEPGSQEEMDLEGVAYLELVRCSRRFDPGRVPPGGDLEGQFRGWCHPSIRGACKREAVRIRNAGSFWTRVEKGQAPVEAQHFSALATADEPFDVADWRAAAG